MADTVLAEYVAAGIAILTLFGGGIQFVLKRLDVRARAEREWERQERAKLEAAFGGRIDALENLVSSQRYDIQFLQSEVHRYVRHVGVLEGLLRAHDIAAPPMEPPLPIPFPHRPKQ